MNKPSLHLVLARIADSLERLTTSSSTNVDLTASDAYIWDAQKEQLIAVPKIRTIPLELIVDVNQNATVLFNNTLHFAQGLPANNALLWGARGMGKSSLIKAVFKAVEKQHPGKLALVELHKDDLKALPQLLIQLQDTPRQFILFCDDLSFDKGENSYKSLKVILDGSVAGQSANVILYATSNTRHLVYESQADNENVDAIHPTDAIEEKISLSDRFGLWLGFYHCSEQEYLKMVEGYCNNFNLNVNPETLTREAKQWALARGNRSGRVAWQYVIDLAGRQGKSLNI